MSIKLLAKIRFMTEHALYHDPHSLHRERCIRHQARQLQLQGQLQVLQQGIGIREVSSLHPERIPERQGL
jgi:hypothetical protein